MRLSRLLLAFAATVATVSAQQYGEHASFEVASVKPTDRPYAGDPPSSPDRFIRRSSTVVQLLGYAYHVEEFQIVGGPEWVRRTRFAVEAKPPGTPTTEQLQLMARRLLAERFGLQTHVETKQLPRYALVRAHGDGYLGQKIRPSAVDCPKMMAARGRDYTPPPLDASILGRMSAGAYPRCVVTARMTTDGIAVFREGIPMSDFARSLWSRVGRVIVDKTGLTGTYDIELETERQPPAGVPIPPQASANTPRDGLSLFTALQEQLGLKLEAERGPVDVVVIDSVHLPTPD